jgi:hypothetical protein
MRPEFWRPKKLLKYQTSWKSLQWKTGCSTRNNRDDKADSRFSQCCESTFIWIFRYSADFFRFHKSKCADFHQHKNSLLFYQIHNQIETQKWDMYYFSGINTYLLALLNFSMEQNPSRKANQLSASQEIPSILWNPKVHCRLYKCPPTVCNLSHINLLVFHAPIPLLHEPS